FNKERIDYILNDSGAKLLITANEIASYVFNFHHSSFSVHHSGQLAYIIYTSGSTGKPKGVMVEHRNVVRLVKNTNFIEFRENERLLQTGALEFDASTFEIWGSLLNGMTLCICGKDEILNPGKLKENITKYNISTMWLTSPLFNQLSGVDVEMFAGLKNLLVGGDVLSPFHINRVRERFPYLNIINGYGPTENTTFSTTFKIDKEYSQGIPIGKPIAHSTAYVVDKAGHPVPVGVSGELLVGGDGVSRGYLNNPELTADKFIFFPNFLTSSLPNFPLYRTGDLARWLEDGNIEFLGRIDQQVKIRGYRIELEEIAVQLRHHPGIKESVVVDNMDESGDKYLCAYIVPMGEPAIPDLREYLAKMLPDYMVPTYFVYLDKIPLTANGKIDHRALPKTGVKELKEYIMPRNNTEVKMVKLWSEVLAIEKESISVHSNFFELGGHSLKAMILLAQIYKEFALKISLTQFFQMPVVCELSQYIVKKHISAKNNYAMIEPVEKKEFYVLSSAQRRLFALQQVVSLGTVYNIPQVIPLNIPVDIEKLTETFKKLIRRHESLRTSFLLIDEEPRQKVHEEVEFAIAYYDLSAFENIEKIVQNFIKPFDLSRAPLLRVGLIDTG
ncbi:MAG TPA: amino acid adenylation domain-containing protein, partial [Candidatus Kapabacteria bacterium]|nr:amino acid adenylation domain-containing protein [Candidatus Kapabacteria bacterium]